MVYDTPTRLCANDGVVLAPGSSRREHGHHNQLIKYGDESGALERSSCARDHIPPNGFFLKKSRKVQTSPKKSVKRSLAYHGHTAVGSIRSAPTQSFYLIQRSQPEYTRYEEEKEV